MKIYLVDDDSEEAELFKDAISKIDAQIELVWYDNVRETLEALKIEKKLPDLLFLDLNIPQVSGKDLLALLRQNKVTVDVRVVIYSTSISKKDIDDTSPYTISYYLQKPEDFKSLCRRLEEIVFPGK